MSEVERVFADVAPIFVVGAPRSGTTLFQRILDAHPRIGVADEIIYFDIIVNVRSEVPDLKAAGAIDALFERLPKMDHFHNWNGLDEVLAVVRKELIEDPDPTYPLFFVKLMQVYARMRGKVRFGDKTPWNVRHLDQILTMFPDARIIHLVRDPRANVASRVELPRTSKDVVTAAVKWRIDVEAAHRFARSDKAHAENYLELRYEDLVTDPEPWVRKVCKVVGEDYDPAMLNYHQTRDVMFKDQPYKEGVFMPVNTASIDAYRKRLKPAQIRLIEAMTRSSMKRLGYQALPGSEGGYPGMPLQLAREVVAWRRFKTEERQRIAAEPNVRFRSGNTSLYGQLLRQALGRGSKG
ncbi:sulfotransferase family protein [Geminicoccus roseus]|uniref:sulfotransferase family protein n=1 Tax=Geminicoccus roseus TaxID=404900 RepID=UPI00040F3A28|nr:sulfotransferase [Geminicoccus roseus]